MPTTPTDEAAIRALAQQLWEARGRPLGDPEKDWFEAERKLQSRAVDKSLKESFPASDPPASHGTDEPPENAAAKWAAAKAHPEQPVAPVPEPVTEVNPRLDRAHARVPDPPTLSPHEPRH